MQQRTYSHERGSRHEEPGRYRSIEGNYGSSERGRYGRREDRDFGDEDRGYSDERYAGNDVHPNRRDYRDDPWNYRSNQDSMERDWSGAESRGRYMNDSQDRDRFANRDYGNRDYGRNQFGREDTSPAWGPSRAGQFNEYGPGPGNWSGGDYRGQLSRNTQDRGDFSRDSSGRMHDERGRFTGMGPKNYRRSDDRIQDDLCEQLTRHAEIDASDIDCKVKDGEVVLSGTVSDRNIKRMAEDLAENISGVKDVRNEIRVKRDNANGSEQDQSQQRAAKAATKM